MQNLRRIDKDDRAMAQKKSERHRIDEANAYYPQCNYTSEGLNGKCVARHEEGAG